MVRRHRERSSSAVSNHDTLYWPDGQVKQITHTKDGVAIRRLNYAYDVQHVRVPRRAGRPRAADVFGNVATQELNNGLTGNTLETFAYDKLHRLTQNAVSRAKILL
jgi:hypothetical protein